ncbi:hypothetical protein KGA66_04290 [Actinocrinis puniceicyclus]|uniref:Uncharacterized protein n=1 Tax=Actinocrinis puniceicyclus TaxID=977794 RepID=A0A8J7WM80_9ACTN|nr:hypothetical protein [Actinocrinis puniceicyclus]MBS2962252.1 hypothetical protein [Actinocrinis puniceicyclus]
MDLTPQVTTGSATAAPALQTPVPASTARLRRASLGALFALLVEYGLGMGVNLFVNVPDADKGKGTGAAFGKAMSNGPAALAAHAGIGILLILNVIVVFVLALRSRQRAATVSSLVALLCVLGAAFSGAAFVDKGANGSSMTMAVLTGVAMACYAVNLFVLGSDRKV